MRLSPERPPDAPISTLAREKQNPAPKDETSGRVRRVGIGDEASLVEGACLSVDVEEGIGPVACQSGVVGGGDQDLGRVVDVDCVLC